MIFATIALATDRNEFCQEMQHHLQEKGIAVSRVDKEDDKLRQALHCGPDLVALDCCHEGVQGLTLCRTIRESYHGPLVLLSHPSQEQFALLALQLGADISLSTQHSTHLISENIRALINRLTAVPDQEFHSGDLKVDTRKSQAFISGKSTHLSTVEFKLLWLLCRKAGQVVSREAIHRGLYEKPYNGYDRSIDLYVSRIREKLGDSVSSPVYLKTIRGVGYQFIGPVGQPEAA